MNMKTIGDKISELRKKKSMTQEALADIIGVSSQTISKWETNNTMPDIMLLPVISGVFDITIDELFSSEKKKVSYSGNVEETPFAVYDSIIENMWAWEGKEDCLEKTKEQLYTHPEQHTGFVSQHQGAAYADKYIGLSYIADMNTSKELLEDPKAAYILSIFADADVRKIMKFQWDNPGVSFTDSSVSAKCAVEVDKAKAALEKLVDIGLTSKQTVNMGNDEAIDVYNHFGDHKLPLLIYPLFYLAGRLADFQENWFGFRC